MSAGPLSTGLLTPGRTRPAFPATQVARTPELDDAGLLLRISGGDAAALGELYDRHAGRAFSLARAICRDPARAEDVVHEAFLSIWRSSAGYQPQRGSPTTWFSTVVRNCAIDALRRDARRSDRNTSTDEIEHFPSPDDVQAEVAGRAEAGDLLSALVDLPAGQREAIALAYFGGLTHKQIASHLGLPYGTVKSRIRLGLEKLRVNGRGCP